MEPTPHSFLGVRQLFWKLPNPGLWELHLARTVNRPVKVIWEIASDFEKRVLVMNPITSRPVQPVNGSMIVCRDSLDPYSAYPPELAEEWHEFASQGDRPRGGWRAHVGQPENLLDRERFGPLLDSYYALSGWDVSTGWPSRAKLEELGLSDIADVLQSEKELG